MRHRGTAAFLNNDLHRPTGGRRDLLLVVLVPEGLDEGRILCFVWGSATICCQKHSCMWGKKSLARMSTQFLRTWRGAWLKNLRLLGGAGRSFQSGLWCDFGGLEMCQDCSMASL